MRAPSGGDIPSSPEGCSGALRCDAIAYGALKYNAPETVVKMVLV